MKKLLATAVLGLALGSGAGAQGGNSYSTGFPTAENPISEGGRWLNGQAVGLDWKNVRTSSGLAYGADSSGSAHYDDPTALLAGSWAPDQTAEATVHSVNQRGGDVYQEVELRLRSTISAHRNSGYEINFRCTRDGSQYVQIVRWNGPLGDFDYVASTRGPGIRDGDTVKASIVGTTISVFINGTQVLTGSDGTFRTGNPGMGFYLQGGAGSNADFGFTSFSASDVGTASPTAPKPATNVRILR